MVSAPQRAKVENGAADRADRQLSLDGADLRCDTRHSENDARRRVLTNGLCARVAQGLQASGTITTHAGQNHADGIGASRARHGVEEDIHGRPVPFHLFIYAKAATQYAGTGDLEVAVPARGQIDASWLQDRALAGFADSCVALLIRRAAKLVVKVAGICWVMTIGGQLRGKPLRTVSNASTPPVEDPIATMRRPGR
jgi:hypothetical protein